MGVDCGLGFCWELVWVWFGVGYCSLVVFGVCVFRGNVVAYAGFRWLIWCWVGVCWCLGGLCLVVICLASRISCGLI